MASTHLTAFDTDDENEIVSCEDHLMVIKKTGAWSNMELVITPCEKYFTAGVVFAKATSYSLATGSEVLADGAAMATQYKALWDSKDSVANWTAGHKPLFVYYARGGGPYSMRVMTDSQLQEYCFRNYEFGGSRVLLKFNTYCFPVGKMTSFKAYVRFYNPSWCYTMAPAGGVSASAITHCPLVGYNKAGYVRIHFDEEIKPPTELDEDGYFEFNMAPHANQGKGDSSTDGSTQYGRMYDMWDNLGSATTSTGKTCSYQRTYIYYQGYSSGTRDVSNYYYDYEITGTALTSLKSKMKTAKSLYMMVGTLPVNGLTDSSTKGVHANSTIMGYCSRIELVFKCTGSKFNC